MRISDWSSDVCSSDLGINTMFNTGTTVGVNVHLYGSLLPPAFVPDFSWGEGDTMEPYLLEKSLETAARIKEQKGSTFTRIESRIHTVVFRSEEHTSELQSLMRISYDVFCLKKNTRHDCITNKLIPIQ